MHSTLTDEVQSSSAVSGSLEWSDSRSVLSPVGPHSVVS